MRQQIKNFGPVILLIDVPIFLLMLGIALQDRISLGDLTRDPVSIARIPVYSGFISNLGIILWVTAIVICLFTAFLVYSADGYTKTVQFLLAASLLTTVLMVDDLFLLHEIALPRLGISEKLLYLIYGGLLAFGIINFREILLKSDYLFALVALGFFGLSLSVDFLQEYISQFSRYQNLRYLFEDSGKFLGIIGWMLYFAQFARREVQRIVA